ncbi:MAG: hypothetical protein WDN69_15205 [Aliidongia sp.]
MVLAELVAGGELVPRAELHPTDGIATLPHRLDGVRLNAGLAIGTAVLHEPSIVIRQVVADNPELELDRLNRATAEMHQASIACSPRPIWAMAASITTSSRPTACSPRIAAGSVAFARRSKAA